MRSSCKQASSTKLISVSIYMVIVYGTAHEDSDRVGVVASHAVHICCHPSVTPTQLYYVDHSYAKCTCLQLTYSPPVYVVMYAAVLFEGLVEMYSVSVGSLLLAMIGQEGMPR